MNTDNAPQSLSVLETTFWCARRAWERGEYDKAIRFAEQIEKI